MKLFGHDTSPYVRRVRVLLKEKGLPFERDPRSWSEPHLARINPMMRVPALIDEANHDQAVLDSRLIAAYLYERYPQAPPAPPPGHPPLQATLWRPEHRWDDEDFLLVIDAAVDSAINVFLLERDGIRPDAAPYLRRQQERTRTCLAWIDARIAGRTTLAPGVFSFCDIALCCAMDWLLFRERYPVLQHEHLARLSAAHRERPSLKETHPALTPAPPPSA